MVQMVFHRLRRIFRKIPQTEDELSLSIINHPVTEVAHREVLKDIRKMSSKKHELDNE